MNYGHVPTYIRLHLIERIMVLRAPANPLRYRTLLERARLSRLEQLNQLLMEAP